MYEKNKTSHKLFPSSNREWYNSIYVYNKNTLNIVPIASSSATSLIKSYFTSFNNFMDKKLRTKKLRIKRRKLSNNKIFLGRNEFKHTNKKVIISLYLFNRQKKTLINAIKKIYNIPKHKSNILVNKKHPSAWRKERNNLVMIIKNISKVVNYVISRYTINRYKLITNIKYNPLFVVQQINNAKTIYVKNLINIIKKYRYANLHVNKANNKISRKILKKNNISKKIFKKELLKLNNNHIYNLYFFLMSVNINSLSNFSLKEIENRLDFAFNEYKTFIRKNKGKNIMLYFYYKELINVNIFKYRYSYLQYLKESLYNIFNKNIEFNLINLNRFYLNSDILTESVKNKITKKRRKISKIITMLKHKVKIKNKAFFHNNLLNKNICLKNLNKSLINYNTIKNISHKDVSGFRIEAYGRLTKRHTASRSVRKVKYKGSLLNVDSSYKGLSTFLLKGNLEASLQHTKLKSKTNIGSFGLKSWVNGS